MTTRMLKKSERNKKHFFHHSSSLISCSWARAFHSLDYLLNSHFNSTFFSLTHYFITLADLPYWLLFEILIFNTFSLSRERANRRWVTLMKAVEEVCNGENFKLLFSSVICRPVIASHHRTMNHCKEREMKEYRKRIEVKCESVPRMTKRRNFLSLFFCPSSTSKNLNSFTKVEARHGHYM